MGPSIKDCFLFLFFHFKLKISALLGPILELSGMFPYFKMISDISLAYL